MAIWTPSEGVSPRFGISGGDLWAAGQGSSVLSNLPRNANRLARRQFRQWTNQGPWKIRWRDLSVPDKEEWEWFAAEEYFHGLTGRPARVGGEEFFIRYWAQAALFDGEDVPGPWSPPDPPVWSGSTKPFEPWLDAEDSMSIVVRTTTEDDLEFFFVGQPPTYGRGSLRRSTCVPLGKWTLAPSEAGARWAEPSAAALELFGEKFTDAAWQQWLLAWELSGYFPRPVLDPCSTPDTPAPDHPPLRAWSEMGGSCGYREVVCDWIPETEQWEGPRGSVVRWFPDNVPQLWSVYLDGGSTPQGACLAAGTKAGGEFEWAGIYEPADAGPSVHVETA